MTDAQAPAQLTPRAIILAIVLAVLLAAANTYLGLFAGLTIASAIPAAVVSMAVLRVLGGSTILENNIVQTGASAGSSIASGVIFTIPALVILGHWTDFRYAWVLAIAGLGGILGVFFSVPLRRSLIVEQNLKFPEGVAAAEVLKAGDNPAQGVKLLGLAALGGGLAKLAAGSGLRVIPDTAAASGFFGKWLAYFGTNLSPALLGVGYIVGLNIGALALIGGMISWSVAIPIYAAHFLQDNAPLAQQLAGADAETMANAIWSAQVRYLGVGAMLVGGMWALVSIRSSLASGIRSGLEATRAGATRAASHTEQDLPMKAILIGLVLFTIPLFVLYQLIVDNIGISLVMTVIMIVAGFVFTSVSAYMAGLVGSSNNPVSGITICTILFASLLLVALMGRGAALGPVAAIMIGSVVCCAACIGGDNLQDLKAGQLVGATPWRQQVMLAIGAASCALVMAPVLNLLLKAYGIGAPTAEHPNALIAPQATLMASVAKGMFGGELPWGMISIGARDRRRHHPRRRVPQARQGAVPRARARRGGGHLPAARAVGADLHRRPDRAPRRAQAWHQWRLAAGGTREAEWNPVRGGPDHGRGPDGYLHRHPDRDVGQRGCAGARIGAAVRRRARPRRRRRACVLAVSRRRQSRRMSSHGW